MTIRTIHTYKRLLIAALLGLLAGIAVAAIGPFRLAPVAAWDVAALVYLVWIWLAVWKLDPQGTKRHAVREDPGRRVADVVVLTASFASLAAVIFLIIHGTQLDGAARVIDLALGLLTVVASWFLMHTIYMLKYARLYYKRSQGEVDFNEKDLPQYTDFAYLALTLGMTYQVSDTDIKTKELRKTIIHHTLLSYLYGTVIIATTINTLASLSK